MTRTTDRGSNPTLRPDLRRGLATVTAVLAGSASMLIATDALANPGTTGPTASTTAAPGGDCLDVSTVSDAAIVIVGHGFPAGDTVTLHLGTTAAPDATSDQQVTATPDGDALFTTARPGEGAETALTVTGEPSGRTCTGRLTGDAITPLDPAATPAPGTAIPTTAGIPSSAPATATTTPSTPGSTPAATPPPTMTPTTAPSTKAPSAPSASVAPSSSTPSSSSVPSSSAPSSSTPSATSTTATTSTPASSSIPATTSPSPAPEAHVLNAQRVAELAKVAPAEQPRPQTVPSDYVPPPTVPQQSVLPSDSSDSGFAGGGYLSDQSSSSSSSFVPTSDPFAVPSSDSLPSSAPVTFGQWSVPSYSSESVTPYVAPSYETTSASPTTTALASTGVPVAGLAVPGLLSAIGGAVLLLVGRRFGAHGPGRR